MRIVIAIGGNMISDASNKDEPFEDQFKRIGNTGKLISDIHRQGHQIIVTHGNGPQVGSLLLQQQANVSGSTDLPLKILGALTQGQIGVSLQHAILNEFRAHDIDTIPYVIPTSVLVDFEDPAFKNPTKPIGPFYSEEEYQALDKSGKTFVKLDKGYRRVVPSPIPVDVVEGSLIKQLYDTDCLLIAVGGGGSPVFENHGKIELVDAVIDKDLASALLARKVDADMLVILTNVDGVFADYGTEKEAVISSMHVHEAEELIKNVDLGAGSMRPKLSAAVEFAKTGGKAIITSPEMILEALKGQAGTRIFKTEPEMHLKT